MADPRERTREDERDAKEARDTKERASLAPVEERPSGSQSDPFGEAWIPVPAGPIL